MKTVLITIPEEIIVRNILSTSFWPIFKETLKGVRVVILVESKLKERCQKIFKSENVTIEEYSRGRVSLFENLLMSVARSSVKSHTNLWSKMRSYERGSSGFFATYAKRAFTYTLGSSDAFKHFLRALILALPPRELTKRVFEIYKPNLLFSTSIANFDFDVPITREARRRKVTIVGMVRSWDNFSSHGMLRVVPDRLILQNQFLREMARRYQAIQESNLRIDVIGLPHYDSYRNPERMIMPREEFFKRVGLDPQKHMVLYGAMGDFLFPREGEIADVFERLISEGKLQGVQVLFRAHPKFDSPLERIKGMKHVIADRKPAYVSESNPADDQDTIHLINSLYHADVVTTAASTLAIDGAILNKPVVCVGFDGMSGDVSYWNSVRRFYDCYTHFEALMETGGAKLAETPDRLADLINRYMRHPEYEREERKLIVQRFAAPFDGKAGERLANILADEMRQLT